jgi:hypothetical protein
MSGRTGIASEVGRGLGRRAKVLAVESGDAVRVSLVGGKDDLLCDVLVTSDSESIHLSPGDEVFVVMPNGTEPRGLVLGRIGPSVDPAPTKEVPDDIVLEAKKGLVLRVGEGSITIRADGKILIKGKDLVSHAKRMNRIKGGAVSLN